MVALSRCFGSLALLLSGAVGARIARKRANTFASREDKGSPVRVACVGDSITVGYPYPANDSYPGQLQELLGTGYSVGNFAENGNTAQREGAFCMQDMAPAAFWLSAEYQKALEFEPDFVFIGFGTNDGRTCNWDAERFRADYADLAASFVDLASQPRVFLLLPPPVFEDKWEMNSTVVNTLLPDQIRQVANDAGARVVDIFSIFEAHCPDLTDAPCDWIDDGIHPNPDGYGQMAHAVWDAITPPVRVACVGDSITVGYPFTPDESYPGQLQGLLGTGYRVGNFAENGNTAQREGAFCMQGMAPAAFWLSAEYQKALEFEPDFVFIGFGTNDGRTCNWDAERFRADYADLAASFVNLASQPRVFLLLPPPVFEDKWEMNSTVVNTLLPDQIRQVANEAGARVVDIFSIFEDRCPYLTYTNAPCYLIDDGIHPNPEGYRLMANAVEDAIVS